MADWLSITASALWFFFPALFANQCPGFARKLDLWLARVPVCERLLGPGKTWAAYYAGPYGALLILCIQRQFPGVNAQIGLFDYQGRIEPLLAIIALGLGPILGDHIKSFIKRWRGKPPGAKWWPWDQLDFVIGVVVASWVLIGWIGWMRIAIIIGFVLVIHPIGNRIGYRLGLRSVPW